MNKTDSWRVGALKELIKSKNLVSIDGFSINGFSQEEINALIYYVAGSLLMTFYNPQPTVYLNLVICPEPTFTQTQ